MSIDTANRSYLVGQWVGGGGLEPRPDLPCPALPHCCLLSPTGTPPHPGGGLWLSDILSCYLALRHAVTLSGSPLSLCHFSLALLTPCHTTGSLLVTQVAHSLSHKWLTPCHTTGSLFVTLLAHSLSHYWLTHCHTTGCWLLAHSLSHYWLTPTGSLLDCPLPLADVDDSPPSRTT